MDYIEETHISLLRCLSYSERRSLKQAKLEYLLDILYCFPVDYYPVKKASTISDCFDNESVSLVLKVKQVFRRKSSDKPIFVLLCSDHFNKILECVWFFGGNYFFSKVEPYVAVRGKLRWFNGQAKMFHPKITYLSKEQFDECTNQHSNLKMVVPVYDVSRAIERIIRKVLLDSGKFLSSTIPTNKYSRVEMFFKRHFPANELDIVESRDFFFREKSTFFSILLEKKALPIPPVLKPMSVDFDLGMSPVQHKAFEKLKSLAEHCGNAQALLYGDVGSGKTMVAFALAVMFLRQGSSVLFMSPTILLARQQYSRAKILQKMGIKLQYLGRSGSGEITKNTFFFGTHSLFSRCDQIQDLGLSVIDEEHKFGVLQREKVSKKMVLYLSATPIPRTLRMALSGNVKMVNLASLERDVLTKIVDAETFPWEEKMREFYERGEKILVLCPFKRIKFGMDSVQEIYPQVLKAFGPESVGCVMGGSINEEQLKKQIVVGTTVLELGLNLPFRSAFLFSPQNLGVSQIHQVRGRVGRDGKRGYCFMILPKVNDIVKQRIEMICDTESGYELAVKDMNRRGSGNLLGEEQSGYKEDENFLCFPPADLNKTEKGLMSNIASRMFSYALD